MLPGQHGESAQSSWLSGAWYEIEAGKEKGRGQERKRNRQGQGFTESPLLQARRRKEQRRSEWNPESHCLRDREKEKRRRRADPGSKCRGAGHHPGAVDSTGSDLLPKHPCWSPSGRSSQQKVRVKPEETSGQSKERKLKRAGQSNRVEDCAVLYTSG